jgi:scyllo-inositol 2-dehydrogenase (NADP+)
MAARMMSAFAKAGTHVTAVVSTDLDRALRFAGAFAIPTAETDLHSVLQRHDVDAVYVANAPQHHAMTCVAALKVGKPVLCEKPIALSEAEAQQVARTAHKSQTLCMEGLWTLLLPAYRHFIALSHSRDLGTAKTLVADFGYPAAEVTDLRLYAKARGGIMLDRGIYLIALALSVLGPVERIDAQLDFDELGVDNDAFLQLQHRSGGHSQLAASYGCLMANTASLSLSGGLARLEAPLIGSEAISTFKHAAPRMAGGDVAQPPSFRAKMIARLRESPRLRRINRTMKRPIFQHLAFGADQYLPELDHFIALLRAGARESDVIPLELSLQIQRIIDAARASQVRPAGRGARS